MENSFLSLLPPLLTISMIIITKRLLLSLGTGILVGALMLNQWNPIASVKQIFNIAIGLFYADGGINTWYVYILLFLFLLGMITAAISIAGGTRAFGEWGQKRIKSKFGAQLFAIILGIMIFFDDYFNSLVTGKVSKPITDRYRVSRSKLAYLIDSTAAPICVIMPISSWGAYIISLIGGITSENDVFQFSALEAFSLSIPMNFYAIFAILMTIAAAYYNINLGQMKHDEQRAMQDGILVDLSKGQVPGEEESLPEREDGKLRDLFIPILTLIVTTIAAMLWTGASASGEQVTLLTMFENTDVAASLFYGGLAGWLVSMLILLSKRVQFNLIGKSIIAGLKSMLSPIIILLFAWSTVEIIGALGTGTYLAQLIDSHLSVVWLPAIMFLAAAFIAFSTGTSWGTFGIMIPIGAEIALQTDPTYFLPLIAAVLAGSVQGDHSSPISDTTVLSSTGAGVHHIDHVMTQLPYSLLVGFISLIGFIMLGLTQQVILSFIVTLALFILIVVLLREKSTLSHHQPQENELTK
ncbi:Na+/H+ antiporter NhaC family protein [Bacillus solimangrovi]|uniref:Sodium:proton antiporter n=1 Tax=Bacillus solimangrovi TaxID=1305675 RepID=A0A1E5LHQ0_9BACI|nr:Na+/H+ antiporter NhaC family protein [Bacillus solimangrovi]OEH93614.1 sodium:proton antiporter [Bacillus solimangrovi]